MKVFVGTDHNGFQYKSRLIEFLQSQGYEVHDDSEASLNPDDDYPVFAKKVVLEMQASKDPDSRGILICGSGQGMCMAANRFKGIRAALGYDRESVRAARNDDDANILCLATRTIESDTNHDIIETFLSTPFAAAPRFNRRIQEMDQV